MPNLTIGLLLLLGAIAFAQPSLQPDVQFDVASIKVAAPPNLSGGRVFVSFGPATGGPGTSDPTHISWTNATLRSVILAAYDIRSYQLVGFRRRRRIATILRSECPKGRPNPKST